MENSLGKPLTSVVCRSPEMAPLWDLSQLFKAVFGPNADI